MQSGWILLAELGGELNGEGILAECGIHVFVCETECANVSGCAVFPQSYHQTELWYWTILQELRLRSAPTDFLKYNNIHASHLLYLVVNIILRSWLLSSLPTAQSLHAKHILHSQTIPSSMWLNCG